MAQCKATTASGTQCVSEAARPSRTLCKRHQTVLAGGKAVINVVTGRKFATPAAGPAPRGSRAPAATAPRASRAGAPRAGQATLGMVGAEEPREARGPGEHSLECEAPRCGNLALPGSDYCMTHQGLA